MSERFCRFGKDAALWTNVFNVNVNGSVMKNCKAAEVAVLQRAQKGLLAEEIAILNPDVVVFFSGPRYESALRCEFPDMRISPLSRACWHLQWGWSGRPASR